MQLEHIESTATKNKYYICLREGEPINFIPPNLNEAILTSSPDFRYFVQIMAEIENQTSLSNLEFYLTYDLNKLPSYGKNVIVFLLGDEHCCIPIYVDKVAAVFKCYGSRLRFKTSAARFFSYLNILEISQFAKMCISNIPGRVKYVSCKLRSIDLAPIYHIPLGYFNQRNLPVLDISERQYDVSFIGSVQKCSSFKGWLGTFLSTPKIFSRRTLLSLLDRFCNQFPEIQFYTSTTPSFFHAFEPDAADFYSRIMQHSKISIVPRGTSLETFRFFESLRYGCIPVVEELPSSWFYDDAPVIRVNKWSDIESLLIDLQSNKLDLQAMHQASLDWWKTKCSEQAVAKYVIHQLKSEKLIYSTPQSSTLPFPPSSKN
jgi:hypothetical protein